MDLASTRVAFGCVAPSPAADAISAFLTESAGAVIKVSVAREPGFTWPDIGAEVGRIVADGTADTGIALCWTGHGVAISASKTPGVRAAYCRTARDALAAREWHDANLLALALDQDAGAALRTVRAWLASVPSPDPRHVRARTRLAVISSP